MGYGNGETTQIRVGVEGVKVTTNAQTDGPNITLGHSSNVIAGDISTSVILGGGATAYNNVIGGDGSATINTITPNTTYPGTGAHVSVIAGYDNVAGQISSKIISDHSYTALTTTGAGHNAIYGGTSHMIDGASSYSMVAGGQSNKIIGGFGSFVSGLRNEVRGTGSVAFGYDNVVTANGCVAFGTANTVNNIYARADGSTNTAAGNFSYAAGNYAHARTVSQRTFTGGRIAALGDAQISVLEMHRVTVDATTVTLGVLNSNTSHQLLINQSVAFELLIVARVAGGSDTSAWKITGMARRGASGTPVLVGTSVTVLGTDAGASVWTVTVTADSAGGLNTRITGEAGKTIRWVQRMTLAEVLAA